MKKSFLGVDIGSISTKGVIIDEKENIIASCYLYTEGSPVNAVKKVIHELKKQINLNEYKVVSIGTTGSARKLIGTMLNASVVKNEITGQTITENVICRPTDKSTLEIYKEYEVDIEKLPKCENFTPLTNYEGLWTSVFVKPLAWLIIKVGLLVKNYGLALIITCILIRLVLYPLTRTVQ